MIQHPVLTAVMMVGAAIGLLLIVWLATEGPGLLEDALDTYQAWPHSGARVDEAPFPGERLPEPATFDLMGNASGWKCMVVVSATGVVTAYWSDEPMFMNRSEEQLTLLEGPSLEGTTVRLAYSLDGPPVCHLIHQGRSSYWVFDRAIGNWTLSDDSVRYFSPRIHDIRIEDTPGNWPAFGGYESWDNVTIEGLDVLLVQYSWWGGGDDETFQAPTILYREPSEEWSTKVVIDRHRVYYQQLAGSSLDDIVIVTYGRHGWLVYSITDDSLTRVGEAPPTHGLPRE